ncbi:UNVERIFIED_CONTAM: GDSL esterase/lipase [Sesamum calycinum]|uniref:GDSL esterase/lipase n=1 Tax=Sesamum calycinum TaxID=2727403 RepID=A0AAW2PNP5_9LAMI
MKLLLTLLLSLLSLSLVPRLAFATGPCHFPAIFNFGDSNSDTGGLSAAFGQAPPPNGESYFHGPAGRYSDGRLVIDFIAKSLGLPYLSAYLDALGSNFTHGANFATAGSTIRPQNTTLHQSGFSPFSLNVQFYQFNDFQRRSHLIREQAGYFLNMTTDQVRAYVPDVLDQFKTVVKSIYERGGRSFWIHNTGPVGCLPYVMDLLPVTAAQVDKVGCAAPFNEVAKYFNLRLKETVVQLRKDLPSAALTYVDVYAVKYDLISQAKKHGFVHPLQACCGHGGKYNYNKHVGCGSKIKVNGKEIMVGKSCKDPSVVINWDGVHYTQAANKWVFDQIVNGAYSDPPIPLHMACHTQ